MAYVDTNAGRSSFTIAASHPVRPAAHSPGPPLLGSQALAPRQLRSCPGPAVSKPEDKTLSPCSVAVALLACPSLRLAWQPVPVARSPTPSGGQARFLDSLTTC